MKHFGHFFLCLAVLITSVGCASSSRKAARFDDHFGKLQPGVTTRDEVVGMFGAPKQYRQNADGSADYVYAKTARSTAKGAAIGTLVTAGIVAVPCIILAPFTFGASLLWIPVLAGAGGIAGGIGGSAVKKPKELLIVHINEQQIVDNFQVAPANINERVLGLK